MYWIFGVKFVHLRDSCTVGWDPAMNIIIARVPVLNVPKPTFLDVDSKSSAYSACPCS